MKSSVYTQTSQMRVSEYRCMLPSCRTQISTGARLALNVEDGRRGVKLQSGRVPPTGAMYFLYLELGLASLVAITVLILLMPLQVMSMPVSAEAFSFPSSSYSKRSAASLSCTRWEEKRVTGLVQPGVSAR